MTLGAAIAVANDPGGMYNPLFIYGGPGLGKTHLMNAIGNEILNDKPDARIKYVSSENFVNDYVQSSRKNQMQEFTDEYRTLDLLLLDDIQFFAKKKARLMNFSKPSIRYMIRVHKLSFLVIGHQMSLMNLRTDLNLVLAGD
jgi:chromosomal replication initiator protein